MRVERRYLVCVVEVFEGEPPVDWDLPPGSLLDGDQDQYVCDNWQTTRETHKLLDDDQLESRVI